MFNEKLAKEYIGLVKEKPDEYYQDYLDLIERSKKSTALYKGEPIPITYQGMFVSPEDVEYFQEISGKIMEISRKVTQEYVDNPEYRKLFAYEKELEDLILTEPAYDMPVPICRYDIFYNGVGDFKFCEFNTDGSSAMNEDSVLGGLMLETEAFEEFGKNHEITQFELFESWVKTSVKIYEENTGKTKPNVAIVDFTDKGTTMEFERFKASYQDLGYDCVIADPRNLSYKNGVLYDGDFPIDLVYRRAVTVDLMEEYENISEFLQAYKDQAFMMLGSFRSQIMHTKLIFKILLDKQTKGFLTDEENSFLENHIPYTADFLTEEDFRRVSKNKDSYILKPHDGYASQGVFTGREHSQEDFDKILREILGKPYIYQEYVDVDPVDFIEFDDKGNLSVSSFGFVLGMFIYGEEFQGLYTRIGKEALISGARDYYTTPNFLVR